MRDEQEGAGLARAESPEAVRNSGPWGLAAALVSFGRRGAESRSTGAPRLVRLEGMPVVDLGRTPVAWREHIPWLWIYLPVVLKWFQLAWRYRGLTLPTAVNPHILTGGFRGESKAACLDQVGPEHRDEVAAWTLVGPLPAEPRERARIADEQRRRVDLAFPLIVKPDVGACGYGVRLVNDAGELETYLDAYPPGESVILQAYVPWAGEAGLFYVRHPDAERGHIHALGLRYYPHVVGDGLSTLRELLRAHPRAARARARLDIRLAERLDEVPEPGEIVRLAVASNLRVGALYRDGRGHVTPALTERIDAIARSMPDFHYGRFDIRFRDIDTLERGEDFRILEINGAGAEDIHVWDPHLSLRDAYRGLFAQHEILFAIAAVNRSRGVRPTGLIDLARLQWRESRLLRRYPPAN